jgi:hypothetical protein
LLDEQGRPIPEIYRPLYERLSEPERPPERVDAWGTVRMADGSERKLSKLQRALGMLHGGLAAAGGGLAAGVRSQEETLGGPYVRELAAWTLRERQRADRRRAVEPLALEELRQRSPLRQAQALQHGAQAARLLEGEFVEVPAGLYPQLPDGGRVHRSLLGPAATLAGAEAAGERQERRLEHQAAEADKRREAKAAAPARANPAVLRQQQQARIFELARQVLRRQLMERQRGARRQQAEGGRSPAVDVVGMVDEYLDAYSERFRGAGIDTYQLRKRLLEGLRAVK